MVHEALSRAADLGNERVMLLDALRPSTGRALASIVRPVRELRSASTGKAKARSAAYRNQAAHLLKMAATEPVGGLRQLLVDLANDYHHLAGASLFPCHQGIGIAT
jgi:response regulator RpfG family c-di-GMP phosphodiesterase